LKQELALLKSWNYDQVLLVTGEDHRVSMAYFQQMLPVVRETFSSIAIEVQPLETDEYATLKNEGVHSVLLYQETYHQEEYKKHHPKGRKSNFDWRLEGPDRIGNAGLYKIGLGVLLGLEDWRTDSFFTALHVDYLEHTYWKTRYSVSFPRLRPFSGGLDPKVDMSDRELVQLICAWRIFKPEVEISLSTRESAHFRDHAMMLGVTTMSAGSRTNPGGYLSEPESLEQFEIEDTRSPQVIAEMIKSKGYEVVWKDWDAVLGMQHQC
jgi:2-iminoacetate synthase